MISNHRVKFAGRAAAILTTSAVASKVVEVNQTLDGNIAVYADFTIGSLTNVILNPQVSDDGTNWYDVSDPGSLTMTATGKKFFVVNCAGSKRFRVQATGTGTVTSSSLTLNFGFKLAGGAVG